MELDHAVSLRLDLPPAACLLKERRGRGPPRIREPGSGTSWGRSESGWATLGRSKGLKPTLVTEAAPEEPGEHAAESA